MVAYEETLVDHAPAEASQRRTQPFWQGWRYAGGKRDLRLDLMRGFAAFAMIADHAADGGVPGGPQHSWLAKVTGGDGFFVSAAEAFVFISGLVMGMVYRPVLQRSGVRAAVSKALDRAGTLYLMTVTVGLLYVAIGAATGTWWAPEDQNAVQVTTDLLTFHRSFFLVDILMLYALLLVLAVPCVLLLSKGLGWLALAASWALWLGFQFAPDSLEVPWRIHDNNIFHLAAWQVLFITALVIGWHRDAFEWALRGVPKRLAVAGIVTLLVGAVVLYIVQVVLIPDIRVDSTGWSLLLDKPMVPVGRLLVFGVFVSAVYALLSIAWKPIHAATGWLLLPLGQNALTAYALHLFAVLATGLYLGKEGGLGAPIAVTTAVQIECIVVVWLAILFWKRLQEKQASQRVLVVVENMPEPEPQPEPVRQPISIPEYLWPERPVFTRRSAPQPLVRPSAMRRYESMRSYHRGQAGQAS